MDNPYQAPTAVASMLQPRTDGYGGLILRLAILAFCSVQFLSLAHQLVKSWDLLSEAISTGSISPLRLAASILFAFLLMLAGVLLLFSRKAAIWLFSAYVPYQLYWFVFTQNQFSRLMAFASLGFLAAFLFYCIKLRRNGQLK